NRAGGADGLHVRADTGIGDDSGKAIHCRGAGDRDRAELTIDAGDHGLVATRVDVRAVEQPGTADTDGVVTRAGDREELVSARKTPAAVDADVVTIRDRDRLIDA